jgi:glycosyltransferase involved in cell wall biosynthesis
VPFVAYCEWYLNPTGANIGFDGTEISLEEKERLRCNNAHVLTTLAAADSAISPTQWQKEQFPKEFHHKISVIHDGVDTGLFAPDEIVKFTINNVEFTKNDEVITYGTRGFEPTRGFPQFMEAAEKLLKKRPNAHILIAGENKVHYGAKNVDYKALMLKNLDLDMNRVHFVGTLPYNEYKKFLQVSTVHVYLTYPFILSWSILDAMSTGCCLVASNTAPVLEVIEDNYNGLLTDFFNVDKIVEKIEYALENKEKMQQIRQNARQSVVEKYDLAKVVPLQLLALQKVKSEM